MSNPRDLIRARPIGPFRLSPLSLIGVMALAAAIYFVTSSGSPANPLSDRIEHCLDDYFNGVTSDPGYLGPVARAAGTAGIRAFDEDEDEVDLGIERSQQAAKEVARETPSARRVGSVIYTYQGGSSYELQAVARCATGRFGTESLRDAFR